MGLFYRACQPVEAGGQVIVQLDGIEQGRYALDEGRTLELAGPIGASVVEIERGAVRVAQAPCRRHICLGTGWVRRPGAVIACLPNRLLLRVQGTPDSRGLDAVSR